MKVINDSLYIDDYVKIEHIIDIVMNNSINYFYINKEKLDEEYIVDLTNHLNFRFPYITILYDNIS